jgi:cytochrome c556
MHAFTSKAETKEATLRVRIEHAEAERSHRQGAYHEFLVLLDEHAAMMVGAVPWDDAKFEAWLGKYYRQQQGLRLFGSQGVREALRPLANTLDEVAAEANRGDRRVPDLERFQSAFRNRRDELATAVSALTDAMRRDVASEVAPLSDRERKPSSRTSQRA